MKNRYRIIRYRRYGGIYYIHDTETDLRWSLRIKDKARATELLVAKNEAAHVSFGCWGGDPNLG